MVTTLTMRQTIAQQFPIHLRRIQIVMVLAMHVTAAQGRSSSAGTTEDWICKTPSIVAGFSVSGSTGVLILKNCEKRVTQRSDDVWPLAVYVNLLP